MFARSGEVAVVTVTPIFDDLAASFAAVTAAPAEPSHRVVALGESPSPRPRPAVVPSTSDVSSPAVVSTVGVRRPASAVVGSAAFGRGCFESGTEEPATSGDAVTRLLEGARREAMALGCRRVDTVHLALAAVRAGGEVGRVFGMRGVGPAVLLAALDDETEGGDELPGGDATRPAPSSVARTVLHRVAHRAAREDRAVTAAELAIAVVRCGRVADLLGRLRVDREDLVDALLATGTPAPGADAVTAETAPLRRVPVPVGVVAPVTVILPAAAPVVPDDHAAGVPA